MVKQRFDGAVPVEDIYPTRSILISAELGDWLCDKAGDHGKKGRASILDELFAAYDSPPIDWKIALKLSQADMASHSWPKPSRIMLSDDGSKLLAELRRRQPWGTRPRTNSLMAALIIILAKEATHAV